MYIAIIIIVESSNPGIIPAKNILPTDCSVTAQYTTITIDGGIKIPSVPALHNIPAANFFGYPALTMPAIIIVPTATTVAGDDPETAAKKVQAKTEAIASPPLM